MKKRPKLLTKRSLVLNNNQGSSYVPDMMLAIQGTFLRVACLGERANICEIIRILENILDELRDIEWKQRQINQVRGSSVR